MGKTSVWRALRAHRCAKPFLSLCAVVGSSVLTASGNLAITATKVDGEMLYFFEVVVRVRARFFFFAPLHMALQSLARRFACRAAPLAKRTLSTAIKWF